MKQGTRRKWMQLLLCLTALCLLVSGCATVPPQQIGGIQPTETATPLPTETQLTADVAPEGGESPQPVSATASPMATLAAAVQPTQVELFYSGTASMMGFADSAQSTIYEQTMEALPATVSLCWPSASVSYYRYGADLSKDSMRMGKEQLLALVGNPSFYRDTALTQQPARLKRADQPLIAEAVNMNEPVRSFYDVIGTEPPTALTTASGTPVAVNAADSAATSLSVIVTDLHELRMDDGALLTALNERSLQSGRTVGLAAISSEFAGLIPDIGTNNTTYVWGAPPSGTLDYLLDYGEYSMGISVDPEQREMAARPFYILVIGDQGAVGTFLDTLEERLTREFTGNSTFKFRQAVFGSGYVPADYSLAGNMRYITGQGVTAVPDTNAAAGVSLVELKASQQERFLQWELEYRVHPSDPRGAANLAAEDFTFIAEAVSGASMIVLPELSYSITGRTEDTVTLSLTLKLPQGVLQPGSYTLEIGGSLTAPPDLPGTAWLSEFGYDADGTLLFDMEQNTKAFDGSRTLFLSRLIDTLGKANLGRLGVAPLGSVQITLTVYA